MKSIPHLLALVSGPVILAVAAACASSGSPVYDTASFAAPANEWRPIPLWFWNNTEIESEVLEKQLEKMVSTDGYGGCAILPFGEGFRPGYLSEDYFRLYGRAVEKAKSLNARMSIYDEYGFPSGSMGAINGSGVTTFKNNHPGHTVKRLDKSEFTVPGGSKVCMDLEIEGKVMSLVAMRGEEIVSLPALTGNGNRLEWEAPEGGTWKVMLFQCVPDGDPNVDYLSPEAVRLFIQDTHEAYYERFKEYFGDVIVSTFFDEPTMYRAQGRMWTEGFNDRFKDLYGFSPEVLYPALWYDIGPGTAAARCALFNTRSTLYSEGFMKTISDWAAKHGILATGHQDQEEIANPSSVSGDLMLVGKDLSMPGIDKIGGGRPTEDFYKVVSSSANCWDKTYVMSETYGDMGNLPIEKMYNIAIEQYTKGINHLIPHAVWYNDANVTFLPELSWRNELYNKDLPGFNLYLSRLNYILARPGRHVADVAMLYPVQSQYAGHHLDGEKGFYEGGVDVPGTDYPEVSRLLTDELGIDFTYIHPEVLDDRCSAGNGTLHMDNKVNSETFKVIILPGVSVISQSNLKRIEEAWEKGTGIIFTTRLPSSSADIGGSADDVGKTVARMLEGDSSHRRAVFVASPDAPSLKHAVSSLLADPDVEFLGGNHPFNYIHKVIKGRDVFFFGNIDGTTSECVIKLRKAPENAMILDPQTGTVRTISFDAAGRFTLSLPSGKSAFIIDGRLLGSTR